MGKWCSSAYEAELLQKFKHLFQDTSDKIRREQDPAWNFSFADFAHSFDTREKFTQRMFEFMIKEAAQKHTRTQKRQRRYRQLARHAVNGAGSVSMPLEAHHDTVSSPRTREHAAVGFIATVLTDILRPTECDDFGSSESSIMTDGQNVDDFEEYEIASSSHSS